MALGLRPMSAFRLLSVTLLLAACGSEDGASTLAPDAGPGASGPLYSVGTIVAEPTGRSLFVQTVTELSGDVDLDRAIEVAGNARHWAYEGAVYVGLGQEPTLVRYLPDATGQLQEDRRFNFQRSGVLSSPPGLVFLSPSKAYLFLHEALSVLVFDPTEMVITGEIDLGSLQEEGFVTELWFPTLHEGRVYVPVRPVNYLTFEIVPTVRVAILDTATDTLLGVADDPRCVAASRPAVGPEGAVYVLGEGRNYITQVLAEVRDIEAPPTCLLRIPAGTTAFDPDYFVDVAAVTGGLPAATAMWASPGEPGVAYAKMLDESAIPEGVEITGANLWGFAAFKFWRLELGDAVVATEVSPQPFSTIDFGATPVDGQLYFGVGDTSMGGRTTVHALDPATNGAAPAFELTGSLREIYRLR